MFGSVERVCSNFLGGGSARLTAAQKDTSNTVRKNVDRDMVYDTSQVRAGQAPETSLTGVMAPTGKRRWAQTSPPRIVDMAGPF